MQTVNVYIYKPTIQVQMVGDLNIRTRNRQLYSHPIKLYKNVNNPIRLVVKDQDQKPIEIDGFDIIVDFCDESDASVIVRYEAVIINAAKGIAQVTISGTDLTDLEQRYYYITIRKRITDVSDTATYIDDNYSVKLPVEVLPGYIRINNDPAYDLGFVSDTTEEMLPDLGGLS